jgi:peptidyl-prolyl cis-trans isomerase A (cyclophilin A)
MIRFILERKAYTLMVCAICALAGNLSAQTNGIYADFTTSLGNFTCQLSYTNAPRAVANFIGLATGQLAWLDLNTGVVRNVPFYDGLTFHRVIAGFMIQGGSPNGLGTDGPGYSFRDEFSASLTFNGPWILAMANSGPNSNGAQFFVTVVPYVTGNNTYTVFGRVVSGTNVVSAINKVTTDSNNKPLTNVVIQSIKIRRVGTAAEAFDINSHGLPLVTNIPLQISNASSQISLAMSNRLYADNRLYTSSNLETWASQALGIETSTQFSNSQARTIDADQQYFRLAQIQYASSTFAPKTVSGRGVKLSFSGGLGTINIAFNTNGTGAYTYSLGPAGTVTNFAWSQDPYRGWLWPIYFSGLSTMTLRLDFSSVTNGLVSGTAYSATPFGVSGTFNLTGP